MTILMYSGYTMRLLQVENGPSYTNTSKYKTCDISG